MSFAEDQDAVGEFGATRRIAAPSASAGSRAERAVSDAPLGHVVHRNRQSAPIPSRGVPGSPVTGRIRMWAPVSSVARTAMSASRACWVLAPTRSSVSRSAATRLGAVGPEPRRPAGVGGEQQHPDAALRQRLQRRAHPLDGPPSRAPLLVELCQQLRGPAAVVLWSQLTPTADVAVVTALPVARPRFRTYVAGPGWAAPHCRAGKPARLSNRCGRPDRRHRSAPSPPRRGQGPAGLAGYPPA